MADLCSVEGCGVEANHHFLVSIFCVRLGLEDFTVDLWLCCEHLEMQANGEPPYVDLGVVARVREEDARG